jgi:transcriptional regulator with XRE-family HTH domain
MTTTKPFREALMDVLAEQDLSQRELIRRTRKNGWGSTGGITNILNSDLGPSMRAMEEIARALQIKPEHFAEYRLAKARESLDPQVVGLRRALRNLSKSELVKAGGN